jgi:enoyl-CoA hydratase/carnithine racemase
MSVRRIALPATLTVASLEALSLSLDEAAADGEARGWVLHGTATGVFCRGMDMTVFAEGSVDASVSLRQFASCISRLRRAPRPTIAVVDGEVMGGGVGLAAACDVVIATPSSTFALPEALFGLLPGVVLPVLIERLTPQQARLMTLRGRTHDAAWAEKHGLADEIVPADQLERAASRTMRELSRTSPARVLGLRSWIHELVNLEPDAALARGAAVTANLVRDPEVREAVRTFVEDGTPPWVGR